MRQAGHMFIIQDNQCHNVCTLQKRTYFWDGGWALCMSWVSHSSLLEASRSQFCCRAAGEVVSVHSPATVTQQVPCPCQSRLYRETTVIATIKLLHGYNLHHFGGIQLFTAYFKNKFYVYTNKTKFLNMQVDYFIFQYNISL